MRRDFSAAVLFVLDEKRENLYDGLRKPVNFRRNNLILFRNDFIQIHIFFICILYNCH